MAEAIEEEERLREQANQKKLDKKEELKEDIDEGTEGITDVLKEDVHEIEKIEKKAQTEVMRFFNAVYERMLANEPIMDSSNIIIDSIDKEDILNILDDVWDELEEAYKSKIVNQMTKSFMIGADRSFQLARKRVETLFKEDSNKAARINLDFKIVKKDIQEYLQKESGTRIRGIKETTRKLIREELAKGFDESLGWKGIMKQIQPIICNPVRAEMIARTEISFAYERSNIKVYKTAGFNRIQCEETIDMKTCDKCKGRHSTIYNIDECPGLLHPCCRVTWLPVD